MHKVANYADVVRPLQLILMVIAILFFARVVRAAQVQARPTEPKVTRREKRRRTRSTGLGLVFIEPLTRADERVTVAPAVVVGRAADCDLSIDDTYLSSRHARFAMDSGELSVEDLNSTNGTFVNAEQIRGRVALERGDIVQVGGVLFEVVR